MGVGGLIRTITISLFAGMAFAALPVQAPAWAQELAQASPELKRAYNMYSRFCLGGRDEDSLHFAKDMARLAEKEFGPDHIRTAGLYVYLAENLRKLGQYDESETLFRHWMPVLERLVLELERPPWNMLRELHELLFSYATVSRENGHMDESESVSARSDAMLKKLEADYPQDSHKPWFGC